MWSFYGFEFAAINAFSYLNLLYHKGFEARKKSLEKHFPEKITSRAGSKHGPCLMNSITDIFVVDLIVEQNGNNLLKMNNRFGADLKGCLVPAAIIDFLISEFTMMVEEVIIFACV